MLYPTEIQNYIITDVLLVEHSELTLLKRYTSQSWNGNCKGGYIGERNKWK